MTKFISGSLALLGTVALAGCMTGGRPANIGTSYECSAGTMLQVSYLANGALVRVNGARGVPFAQTPANEGQIYENGGSRLHRIGNQVTWNTSARSAAETCRVVNTIN